MFLIERILNTEFHESNHGSILLYTTFVCNGASFVTLIEYSYRSGWFYQHTYFKTEMINEHDTPCPFCHLKCYESGACSFLNNKEVEFGFFHSIIHSVPFLECIQSDKNTFRIKMALKGAFTKKGSSLG